MSNRYNGFARKALAVFLAFAMVATEAPMPAIADSMAADEPLAEATADPAEEPEDTVPEDESAVPEEDAPAAGETVTVSLDDLMGGAGLLGAGALGESKAANNSLNTITVELQFQDNNGMAANPEGDAAGKTYYAYIAGKNQWGNAERRITVPLEKVDGTTGLYRATVDALYDQNGGDNNGAMFGVQDGLTYTAIVYSPRNAGERPSANASYDQNNKYNLTSTDADKAFGRYDVTLASDNVAAGGTVVLLAKDTKKTFAPATVDTDYKAILGGAVDFGVVTERFDGAEAETNVAALVASNTAQTGNDLTNNVEQTFMFASLTDVFGIKGEPAYVLVPSEYASKVQPKGAVVYIDASETQEQISARVSEMLSHAYGQSSALAAHEPNADVDKDQGTQKYVLNLSDKGAGTYYVELDDELYPKVMQNGMLYINKRDDQVVIFNVTASDSIVNQYGVQQYTVNGVSSASLLNATGNVNTRTLVWNFPNTRGNIVTTGSSVGIFLAPNATVVSTSTAAGWVIAKGVKIGSGEWHNTHGDVKKVFEHVDKVSFVAGKTIDGKAAEASGFVFRLERLTDGTLENGSFETVAEVSNEGSDVSFGDVTFSKNDLPGDASSGYVYFRITESQGAKDANGRDYVQDRSVYYARVSLRRLIYPRSASETDILIAAGKPEYFKDAACSEAGAIVGVPTFDNKSEEVKKDLRGEFTLTGAKKVVRGEGATAAGFSFEMLEGDKVVANGTSDADGNITFGTIAYDESAIGLHSYLVREVVPEGKSIDGKTLASDGYLYGNDSFAVSVTVADDNDGDDKLDVTSSVEGKKEIEFTNTKVEDGIEVSLSAKKQLNGEGGALRAFRFELTGGKGNVQETKANDVATGVVTFDGIRFDRSDIGKTYTYVMSEVAGEKGVSYDSSKHTYNVTIGLDGETGKLVATVDPADGARTVVFSNASDNLVSKGFSLKKTLSGDASGHKLSEFTFSMYKVEDGERVAVHEHVAADETGDLNFGDVTFRAADLGGAEERVLEYVVVEDVPADAKDYGTDGQKVKDGIIYDTHVEHVFVRLSLTDAGALKAEYSKDKKSWSDDLDVMSFGNSVEEAKQLDLTGGVTLTATKRVEGQGVKAGDAAGFDFVVIDDEGKIVSRGQSDADGNVTFSRIDYSVDAERNDLGKHAYTVREVLPEGEGVAKVDGKTVKGGIIYGEQAYQVEVDVEKPADKKSSELVVTSTIRGADQMTFTNTKAGQASVVLSAEKQLNGEPSAVPFEFELRDEKGTVLQTKTNDASGNVTFDQITYGIESVGKHTYTVSEVNAGNAGITYDDAAYTYEVTVALGENGALTSRVELLSSKDETATFKNASNDITSVGFGVKKTLAGNADGRKPEGYAFDLLEVNGKDRTRVSTVKTDGQGVASFEGVTFTAEQLGEKGERVFEYVIAENLESTTKVGDRRYKGDVAYDTHEEHVFVRLSLDEDGSLRLAYSRDGKAYTNDLAPMVFTNEVENLFGSVTLSGTKELTGQDVQPGDMGKFSFEVVDQTDAKAEPKVVSTGTSDGKGNITFQPIAYSLENGDLGTHRYVVREVIPADAIDVDGESGTKAYADGYVYGGETYVVTVTVAKADGKLDVSCAFEGVQDIKFTNTKVNDEVEVSLSAKKQLNGANGALREFSFELRDAQGEVLQTKQNSVEDKGGVAAGAVQFDALKFGRSDLGKTYAYTVSEVNAGVEGVTYDPTTYTYEVAVGVDDAGKLTSCVVLKGGATSAVFGNASNGVKSAEFTAHKDLPGKTDQQSLADYSFTMFQIDGEKRVKLFSNVHANEDGSIDFGSISFDASDLEGATERVFEYVIVEDTAGTVKTKDGDLVKNGVAYDQGEKHVFVRLALNEAGALELSYSDHDGDYATTMPEVTFTNSMYEAVATKSLGEFGKSYFGSGANEFQFELRGADEKGDVRGVAGDTSEKNLTDRGQDFLVDNLTTGIMSAGEARVTLPEITYHEAGDYYYLLQERGTVSEANDSTQFLLHVTVTQGENLGLTVSDPEVSYRTGADGEFVPADGNAIEFYNNGGFAFRTLPLDAQDRLMTGVSVEPTAQKVLEGGQMVGGEFKFEIVDEMGNTKSEGKNAADGQVEFGRIKYTESDAGHEYRYRVLEAAGGDQQVKYDDAVYTMVVSVEKREGRLAAAVRYEDADGNAVDYPTFTNKVKTARVSIQKRSKEAPFDPLEGATYGMWRYVEGGNDIYMGNDVSDKDGMLSYDVPLTTGVKYYFKEESAPEGHLVDPYPSEMFEFTRQDDGTFAVVYSK